ncbi:MAG TPA: methyltransferase domain-containing protein [Candidatus Methanoperedens sp.]
MKIKPYEIPSEELKKKRHKCTNNKIGVKEKVDFVLAFYMVHEVSDQVGFFREIKSVLKPDGNEAGLKPYKSEKVFFSRAIVLVNENNEKSISLLRGDTVDNIEDCAARVESLGGKILVIFPQ